MMIAAMVIGLIGGAKLMGDALAGDDVAAVTSFSIMVVINWLFTIVGFIFALFFTIGAYKTDGNGAQISRVSSTMLLVTYSIGLIMLLFPMVFLTLIIGAVQLAAFICTIIAWVKLK